MNFDVKVDFRIKACLVIVVHVVDSTIHKVYEYTIKSVSARTMLKIGASKVLGFMTGDIGNSYLNADANKIFYTFTGPKFELIGIMDDGTLFKFIRGFNGLPMSVNHWHAHM